MSTRLAAMALDPTACVPFHGSGQQRPSSSALTRLRGHLLTNRYGPDFRTSSRSCSTAVWVVSIVRSSLSVRSIPRCASSLRPR